MLVLTTPRCLRPIFMRERTMLGDFARTAYECTYRFYTEHNPYDALNSSVRPATASDVQNRVLLKVK